MLFHAIREKNVDTVRKLLSEGEVVLDPPAETYAVNKPLAYACAYGNLEIVKMLVEAGADINGQVAYGDVPLIKADEHGNHDVVEYLIKNGADVNIPNTYGVTPFIGLCGQGRLELVELAAQHGGDVNSSFQATVGEGTGTKNFSAFQAAVARGRTKVVALLLSMGADPEARDYKGRSPLELAEEKKHEGVVRLLREHLGQTGEVR